MNSQIKYFLARVASAALLISLFSGSPASAETDPFPSIALGGEIGSRQAVSPSTGNPIDGSPIITCPSGAGLAGVADFIVGNYVVCTKTWRPSADIDADRNFRTAQELATAEATKQSQDWNAANPGQQKCFQWGPIVHANGVSTSSGGVCANIVPVTSISSGAGSETSTSSSSNSSTSDSSTSSSIITPSQVETVTNNANAQAVNGLAGVGGWAVIDASGKVYGVVVCDNSVCGVNGSWGGVMPVEYMGCPVGCRLVLQTSADPQTGNVAGWRSQEGTDVIYNSQTNTFAVQQENQTTPSLIITPPSATSLSFATSLIQPPSVSETSTVLSDSSTVQAVTPLQTGPVTLPPRTVNLDPVSADVIPLESDGEEIDAPPSGDISIRKEPSGKYLISLDSNVYEDELMVRAFKKGSKLVIFKVKTNIDGRAAIRTSRNLAGYKLAVYTGDVLLDSVKL